MWAPHTPRTWSRQRRGRALAVIGVALLAWSDSPLHAQNNFSGLQGKQLQAVTDPAAYLEESANRVFGAGTHLTGQIDAVTVTDDGERRLTIRIGYSGFSGAQLWGEVRGADRNPQAEVPATAPVTLGPGPSQIDLTFDLAGGLPNDPRSHRRSCAFRSNSQDKSRAGVIRTFQLGKRWQQTVEPQNVVVRVTASPVGAAAHLGAAPTPALARPQIVLQPLPIVLVQPASPAPARAEVVSIAQPMVIDEQQSRITPMRAEPAYKHLPSRRLINIDDFKPGVAQPDADQGAKGPANQPINLLEGIAVEDVELDQTRILSMLPRLFPDQNPLPGIFYFLPTVHHLTWDASRPARHAHPCAAATPADEPGQVVAATQLD